VPGDTAISYTIKRAQEVTGLGKTKLYELINSGELPVVEVDDRTLVLDEDVRALLARRRVIRGGNGTAPLTEPAARRAARETRLAKPIAALGLGTRARNALLEDGVGYVGQLVQKSEEDVLATPGIGLVALDEIKAALAHHKLRFDMRFADWRPPADSDQGG